MSETAGQARGGQLAVAIPSGIAAGLLARLVLFVWTRPHSVFARVPDWQGFVGLGVGGIVGFVLLRRRGPSGPAAIAASILFLLAVIFLHWALFDLRLAQRMIPDLWVK